MEGSSGGVAPEGSTEAGPSDASMADMTVVDASVEADATIQPEAGDTGVAADTSTSDGNPGNPCSQSRRHRSRRDPRLRMLHARGLRVQRQPLQGVARVQRGVLDPECLRAALPDRPELRHHARRHAGKLLGHRPALRQGIGRRHRLPGQHDGGHLRSRPPHERDHGHVDVHRADVRVRGVRRLVHSGPDAVQWPAAADLRFDRIVAGPGLDVPVCVHEQHFRRRRGRQRRCRRRLCSVVHGRVHARIHAVQRPAAANVRRDRRMAEHRQPLPRHLQRGCLCRIVHRRRDAVHEQRGADVRDGRHLGHPHRLPLRVRDDRLRRRRRRVLRGRVHAGRHTLLGQRSRDLRRHRQLEHHRHGLRRRYARLRGRCVRGMHPWHHPVRPERQRRDLLFGRPVGSPGGLHQPGLPLRRVLRRLRARRRAVHEQRRRDVRRDRPVERPFGVHRPGVRRQPARKPRMRPRKHPVQLTAAADLQRRRSLAEQRGQLPLHLQQRDLQRVVHAGGHSVQRPAAPDLRRHRHLAEHVLGVRRHLQRRHLRHRVHGRRHAVRQRRPRDLLERRARGEALLRAPTCAAARSARASAPRGRPSAPTGRT